MTLEIAMAMLASASAILAVVLMVHGMSGARRMAASALAAFSDRIATIAKDEHKGLIDEADAERRRMGVLREVVAAIEPACILWRAGAVPVRAVTAGALIIAGVSGFVSLYAAPSERATPIIAASAAPAPTAPPEAGQASAASAPFLRLAAYARRLGEARGGLTSRGSALPAPTSGKLLPVASSKPVQQSRPVPGVDVMIRKLTTRLEATPDDAEGWRMLGWSWFRTGHYDKAAGAYARAVALRPNKARWQSAYGETLVMVAGDRVHDTARKAFEAALALDAKDWRARYYLALDKAKSKSVADRRAALATWTALRDEMTGTSDTHPGLVKGLDARIAALSKILGADAATDSGTPDSPPAKAGKTPLAKAGKTK